MELSELEKELLIKTFKRVTENDVVSWRVAVRAQIDQTMTEAAAQTIMARGVAHSHLLCASSDSQLSNAASGTLSALRGHLENLGSVRGVFDWGYGGSKEPAIWRELGYVAHFSKRKSIRSEAEALQGRLTEMGLDCFIVAEMPALPAITELSVCRLIPRFAKEMVVDRLPVDQQNGLIYGSITDAIKDEKLAAEAKSTIDGVFEHLEKMTLVSRVNGVRLCWEWSGFVFTREGINVARDLEEQIRRRAKEDARVAPGIYHVRCPACTRTEMVTTVDFDPDRPVRGWMLDFADKFKRLNWSLPFKPSDVGQNIVCSHCQTVLIGTDNRFLSGVLVDQAAETEDVDGRKIDDEELLRLVDSGKSQVEIAGIFGCSKQAVSKRLKALREAEAVA